MKKITLVLAMLMTSLSFSQTFYNADFTNDGDGFPDHTTANPPAPAPASVTGGTAPNNWELSYNTEPSSDGTPNSFKASNGALVSNDWGGQGIFQSSSIDVSSVSTVYIFALTQVNGANDDNFTYFYILDGGNRVETIISDFSTDLIYSIPNLDVSAASSLIVGFEFSENGSGNGYSTLSFTVDQSSTCGVTFQTESYSCVSNTTGDNNDNVVINIPYSGIDSSINSISTTSTGTIGGDNPSSVSSGFITISGLSEGDTWDITINGGDCNGSSLSGSVPASECNPVTTDLVINEIHADPAGDITGDANGDGVRNVSDDEFVELYNMGSGNLDISGFTIEDGSGLRHTFPENTVLPANSFITVFGGGTPTGISGLVQVASEGTLSLNNSGDDVIVKNSSGLVVVSYSYSGATDQSIGRSPDFTGTFVNHSTISGNNGALFSPNLRNNDSTLSSNEFNQNKFSIYPNPVSNGVLTIETTSGENLNVEFYNMLGQQVMASKNSKVINVSSLNSGIYLVKINQGSSSLTKKVIIK